MHKNKNIKPKIKSYNSNVKTDFHDQKFLP